MPLVSNETERIALSTEGEWVEVKKRLSKGDRTTVTRALVRGTKLDLKQGENSKIDSIDADQAIEASTWATLEVAFVAWSFYDGPPKPEDIRRLTDEDYDLIIAALNDLYPAPLSEEESGNSDGSGATTSSEKAPLPMRSAGSQ
jgi:hypothetical protein